MNSWLAARRPHPDDLVDELDTLSLILASRTNTARAALPPIAVLAGIIAAPTPLFNVLAHDRPVLAVAIGVAWVLFTLLCAQMLLARWWLRRLYRQFGGDRRAADVTGDAWHIKHTFVASDLSLSGSVFFSLQRGRLVAFSSRRGVFEPDLTLSTLLRASTALPPALPPLRVDLGVEKQLSQSSEPTRLWLADGGLTGNLGIQLSEQMTGDNPFLQTSVEAYLGEGPIPEAQLVVVDASGTSPTSARLADVAFWIPGFSLVYESLRSLKVQYEAALADDQHLARLTLVSVTRHADAYQQATLDGVEPEARSAMMRVVHDQPHLALFLGLALDERAVMCVGARSAAAEMSTGLWPAAWRRSLSVIRSGYVNTYVNLSDDDADQVKAAWERHEERLDRAHAVQGRWGLTGAAVLDGKSTATTARLRP